MSESSQSSSVATRKKDKKSDEKKPKDRIKTLEQFQFELNALMEKYKDHKRKADECKKLGAELKVLRERIVPFMLENLKQHRMNCKDHQMYITSTITHRARKVHLEDVYEIIEKELGPANRELIQRKALELRKQKVAMRQTKICPISTKRIEAKRKREEEQRAAVASGQPLPKRTRRTTAKKNEATSIES